MPETIVLKDLFWLAGDWRCDLDGKRVREHWTIVSPKTLEGTGITTSNGGESIVTERLRLIELGKEIYYIAKVDHNKLPICFRMQWISPEEVRFVNEEHDFPTQIIYRKQRDDRFIAIVKNNEKQFTLDFIREPISGIGHPTASNLTMES